MEKAEGLLMLFKAVVLIENPEMARNEPWPSGLTISTKRKRTDKVRRKGFGEMIAERGGEDVVLVMEKSLTTTDVSRSHGCVSLPAGKLREQFLNEQERLRVDGEGMDVAVVDERFRNYNLRLTNWKMGTTRILNLYGDWNQVVRDNELAPGDVVQLWSYRLKSRLCFGVIKLKPKSIDVVDYRRFKQSPS